MDSRPTTLCTVKDARRLDQGVDGSSWLGSPLSQNFVKERYPDRPTLNPLSMSSSALAQQKRELLSQAEEREGDAAFMRPAVAHFAGVRLEPLDDDDNNGELFDVYVGDFVLIDNDDHESKAQITELYQALTGERRYRVHWFYDAMETELVVHDNKGGKTLGGLEIDPHQLFRAKDRDNVAYLTDFPMGTILRKINVLKLSPGTSPPNDASTYWWNTEVDRRFFTFEAPQADQPPTLTHWQGQVRELRKMDVFAGAGGLAYMGEQNLGEGCVIVNRWAVDYEVDMTATFKANFQQAHVITSGTDEWLCLCQDVYGLYERLPKGLKAVVDGKERKGGSGSGGLSPVGSPGWLKEREGRIRDDELIAPSRSLVLEERFNKKGGRSKAAAATENTQPLKKKTTSQSSQDDEEFEVDEILAIRLAEKGARATLGSCKNQLEDFLQDGDHWLEFEVRWKGYGPEDDTWEPVESLEGCMEKVAKFVYRLRRNKLIPFPGEVDLLVGGPPCQGVSGNNRHALTKNILRDPRNRQVLVFLAMVQWWRPAYVLMENVQDTLKKEDGAYVKYAMGQMIMDGYQTRLALMAAGMYGVAQGRWRVFMWAARNGEQLPAFPEPTHNVRDFQCAVVNRAKLLTAGFITPENALDAHPPVLLGDVLTDLPEVDNFELGDRTHYAAPPSHIPQVWLRRNPLPGSTPVEKRLAYADEYNGGGRVLNAALLKIAETKGVEALGAAWMNFKNPIQPSTSIKRKRTDDIEAGNFCFESIQGGLAQLTDPARRKLHLLQIEASRKGYAHEIGLQMKQRLEEYFAEGVEEADRSGELTSHRPLCCNTDDYLRLVHVPPRLTLDNESSFRCLEGVYVHPGTCTSCAGHTHAPRLDGKTNCPGGGAHDRAEKAHRGKKQGRVDHHDADGWRGAALEGCPSFMTLMPTGDLLCPRWCITFKDGRSMARTACFGRLHYTEIMPTVVGRAEPHNLRIGHPTQHRVLTIREMARCQGFPDYHVLCGAVPAGSKRWVRNPGIKQRYQQMGNAVSPALAAALGRCLALAAVGKSPVGEPVISAPCKEYDHMVEEERMNGLSFYYETVPNGEEEIPIKLWILGDGGNGMGGGKSGVTNGTDGMRGDEEEIEGGDEEQEESDEFEDALDDSN